MYVGKPEPDAMMKEVWGTRLPPGPTGKGLEQPHNPSRESTPTSPTAHPGPPGEPRTHGPPDEDPRDVPVPGASDTPELYLSGGLPTAPSPATAGGTQSCEV